MSQIGVHPLTYVHAHWLDLFITQSTCNNSKLLVLKAYLLPTLWLLLNCGFKSGPDLKGQ